MLYLGEVIILLDKFSWASTKYFILKKWEDTHPLLTTFDGTGRWKTDGRPFQVKANLSLLPSLETARLPIFFFCAVDTGDNNRNDDNRRTFVKGQNGVSSLDFCIFFASRQNWEEDVLVHWIPDDLWKWLLKWWSGSILHSSMSADARLRFPYICSCYDWPFVFSGEDSATIISLPCLAAATKMGASTLGNKWLVINFLIQSKLLTGLKPEAGWKYIALQF